MPGERSWCKQGVRYFKRCEYEIIYSLKDKYGINFHAKQCPLTVPVTANGQYEKTSQTDMSKIEYADPLKGSRQSYRRGLNEVKVDFQAPAAFKALQAARHVTSQGWS